MVKVIEEVPVHERRCPECKSLLEYTYDDVQSKEYKDISQCVDTYYWIICPKCKTDIRVVKP